MSGRSAPWRSKPPEGFEAQVEAALSIRMFLLQECGPTAFMVKVADAEDGEEGADGAEHRSGEGAHGGRNRRAGDQGKKFKVQIGGSMECSCKSKGELPCVHLLFVLVKLLRVPMENPLVWQASLLDGEVEQILRGRFKPMAEKKKKPDAHTDAVERKEIDEDDICAICQESLSEGSDVLTWCRQSCGNNVHAKCMKVWADHKLSVNDKVTCPFCREDWGPLALDNIKKEIRNARRPPNVHVGVRCSVCRACPVTGSRFRCVVCLDVDLCEVPYLPTRSLRAPRS